MAVRRMAARVGARASRLRASTAILWRAGYGTESARRPSINGAGNVYVVWSDCRFRTGVQRKRYRDEFVIGWETWSAVTRIPIDPTTSTVDSFLPGIGVDPTTRGSSAHMTIVYYYYLGGQLQRQHVRVGGGFCDFDRWWRNLDSGSKLAGPMKLAWLPVSDDGPIGGRTTLECLM